MGRDGICDEVTSHPEQVDKLGVFLPRGITDLSLEEQGEQDTNYL